jgi:flavorubredoxin
VTDGQAVIRAVPPVDIVPGALTRLGGLTPLDESSGWVPAGTRGAEPVNVYLLREGQAGLLIDSGPRALTSLLLTQLEECWTGSDRNVVLLRNELEAIGGLGPLLARYPDMKLIYPGGGGILDWIDYRQRIGGEEHDLRFEATLVLGHPDAIELGPDRRIRYVPPAISNLTITWLYDEATRALFSTDAFALLHVPAGTADAGTATLICDELPVSVTPDYIAAHLAERFFWLRKAEVAPAQQSIRAFFEQYPVSVLCPSRGAVIRGSGAVAQLVDRTVAAMDLIPRYAW